MNRLFTRYPWLCFLLAIVVIANNYLKFAPGQASEGPMSWIAPGILVFLGCMGYLVRNLCRVAFNKNQKSVHPRTIENADCTESADVRRI